MKTQRGKTPQPKTQRQISVSLQTAYDQERGNPNNANFQSDIKDRGNQQSFRKDNTKIFSLGLKEVDEAIFYYINNVIKPEVIQNGVVQKVPLYYGSPERWVQVQKKGYLQDRKGKIMMPLITFKRSSITNDRSLTNKLDANDPHNVQIFQKSYNRTNEYDKFNILNNRTPVKTYYAVVVPDYVTVEYDFIISTYYVEQMNKIVEAMNYASDSYWGDPERFKFRARIDSITNVVELPAGAERVVKSTFKLKLRGYIVPDVTQKQLASVKKFNNSTQIIFKTEMVEDIRDIPAIRNANLEFNLGPPPQIESDNNPVSME